MVSDVLSQGSEYSAPNADWEFTDWYLSSAMMEPTSLLRNSVFHAGDVFPVESVSRPAFKGSSWLSALCVSRNITRLGDGCCAHCWGLQIVAFEGDSRLVEISADAFEFCNSLRSIAIPRFVGLLGRLGFGFCESLQAVMFEPPSRLTTISEFAFFHCQSLDSLCIPASVTEIAQWAFENSGIRSIGIEEGSVSFRVVSAFLVDFEVRSLVWVIGSPESIVIPSSIETLGQFCGSRNRRLRTVEFESNSNLRSIGEFAFRSCESICIPSSVEVLREGCFWSCAGLRRLRFGAKSHLRAIEEDAFCGYRSLKRVSVPASR
jgi:hypothetical protein